MSVKLLTEHNLEFLSLKGGCTGSPESTLVKMPHCWKSHVAAQIIFGPKKCFFLISYQNIYPSYISIVNIKKYLQHIFW